MFEQADAKAKDGERRLAALIDSGVAGRKVGGIVLSSPFSMKDPNSPILTRTFALCTEADMQLFVFGRVDS